MPIMTCKIQYFTKIVLKNTAWASFWDLLGDYWAHLPLSWSHVGGSKGVPGPAGAPFWSLLANLGLYFRRFKASLGSIWVLSLVS